MDPKLKTLLMTFAALLLAAAAAIGVYVGDAPQPPAPPAPPAPPPPVVVDPPAPPAPPPLVVDPPVDPPAPRPPPAGEHLVVAAGQSVMLAASATYRDIDVHGVLALDPAATLDLKCVNLRVHPSGQLRAAPAADAIQRIIFRDVPLDAADGEQAGNGLVARGKVTLRGAAKASFVRLAAEALAGDTSLALTEAAAGWRVGDRLVLPDSRQWRIEGESYVPRYEDATIAAISADGRTITLVAPLLFDHPGARNGDGVLEFLPHVANRTRNVIVKSESGSGTRGYTLFTGRADVDIRYVAIQTLGRTQLGSTGAANVADRHPVTFSHLYGPAGGQANGHQFTFIGNAITCGLPDHNIKWGLTIRDSHYGLIQGNFLYNWHGAGIITASGNESYNVIEKNIVIRGRGVGDREGWVGESKNRGDEGGAYWFRGPNNYVRGNVGANYHNWNGEAAYGFKFYLPGLETIRVPNFAGADTTAAGQYTERDGNAMPLLEFAGNETYGVENALTIWWLNAKDIFPQGGGESVVRDFRAWHIARYGFYGYPMSKVTFDGYVFRGDPSVLANVNENVMGMWFGDYMTKDLVVRRADIQGARYGIIDPYFGGSHSLIEDSYFRNVRNITVQTLRAPGSGGPGSNRKPKSLVIRNVRHGSTAGWEVGDQTPRPISMSYRLDEDGANFSQPDTVHVYDHDGVPAADYRLYYAQQAADFVMPHTSGGRVGAPEPGLTNQQAWERYGVAIAGAVAPADAVRVEWTNGLVKAN